MRRTLQQFLALSVLMTFNFVSRSQTTTSGNDKSEFEKGKLLSEYFPLDSIKTIRLRNYKGEHILSKKMTDSLARKLYGYHFTGNRAATKPGHIWGTIVFNNEKSLSFYSNSHGDLIITNGNRGIFSPVEKVNMDNF